MAGLTPRRAGIVAPALAGGAVGLLAMTLLAIGWIGLQTASTLALFDADTQARTAGLPVVQAISALPIILLIGAPFAFLGGSVLVAAMQAIETRLDRALGWTAWIIAGALAALFACAPMLQLISGGQPGDQAWIMLVPVFAVGAIGAVAARANRHGWQVDAS